MSDLVIQVAANREWRSIKAIFQGEKTEWEVSGRQMIDLGAISGWRVRILFGGVGKINSAASAQYAISELEPDLVAVIGTCGAVDPFICELDLILATRTLVYDIHSSDAETSRTQVEAHTTHLPDGWDISHLPFPVTKGTLATGDGDPDLNSLEEFQKVYGALAVDWESGAVAKVCGLNRIPCLILKGVSDLLRSKATGISEGYKRNTPAVMERVWTTLCVLLERHTTPERIPTLRY